MSSKPSGELDDMLHSLKCLKEAEGEEWALLLRPTDRSALCAVLNKHMQHALVLQTVQPWLSMKVRASAISSVYAVQLFYLFVAYSSEEAFLL